MMPASGSEIGPVLSRAMDMHRAGRTAEASGLYETLLLAGPDNPDLLYLSGLARLELGDLAVGAERMKRLVAVQPRNAAARQALGKALFELGQTEAAADELARALQIDPAQIDAAIELARISLEQGRKDTAEQVLLRATEAAPRDARPRVNLGNVYRETGREEEALETWKDALALDPASVEARSNIAIHLAHQNSFAAATDLLQEGISRNARSPGLFCLLGSLQIHRGRHSEAAENLDRALALQPDFTRARLLRAQAAMYLCDWDALDRARPLIAAEIEAARDGRSCTLSPFFALQLPTTEEDRLAVTRARSVERARSLTRLRREFGAAAAPGPKDRLHIGYLSADWREHPNAQVMCGAFGHHDREDFEISVFADCADDGSETRREIDRNVDRVVEIAGLSEFHAARTIRDLGVDILVDVQGFTGTGRPNIPALRPAPVQVLYQAFCCTTGSDWIDYLVVDATVVPEPSRPHYSEALVYMPHCYMVANDTTPIGTQQTTRADHGLPADGIVLCSFSNPYKITRDIFARWMAILDRVPGSVLWLIGGPEAMMRNLRAAADSHGIDPARVVFADRRPKPQHLERHRHADLFLDTPIYCAHVSALDSLWTGSPVLTCRGDTFVSRVGASFLVNLGLEELICEDLDAYAALATDLCNTPDRLDGLRRKLADALRTAPLFDTAGWISDVEKAYRAMWDAAVAGEHPRTITIR